MNVKELEKKLAFAKKVAKDNAAFAKMTPAQKRVALAKDVLAALQVRRFVASPGTYVNLNNFYVKDGQEAALTEQCNVCALGGLFTCAVVKKNRISGEEMNAAYAPEIHKYLRGIFSSKQLDLIEYAFEVGEIDHDNLTNAERDLARGFGLKAGDNARKRMVAIMKNIIKNNGTFVP